MLTSIDYVAPPGAFWPDLTMYLTPPDPMDPLLVRKVTGLEPVVAQMNSRPYGVVDGEYYNGARLPKRNIVITFGLNTIAGAGSVAGARDLLYRYFLPKNAVKLQFNFDNRDPVEIEGYVESLTGDRFSQDPDMQLSVINPKPNFKATEPVVLTGTTHTGSEATAPFFDAPYIGDAGGGIEFEMEAGPSSVFSGDLIVEYRPAPTAGYRRMSFSGLYVPQDWTFYLSTHQGNKRAESRPPDDEDFEPMSQLAAMQDVAYWMQLFAGENEFRIRTPGATARDWTLTYTDNFVGV